MASQGNFRESIRKLVELEEEETRIKDTLNKTRQAREELNDEIIEYMEKNGITEKDIVFGNKKIRYVKSANQISITKKLIHERLAQYYKNEGEAEKVTNFLYSDRERVEKVTIRVDSIREAR